MVQLKIITCLNFQNSSPIDCLGTWIVTSLSKNTRGMIEHEVGGCLHTWNEINIPNLWLIALRNNFVGTLAMSLDVFLPVRVKCFIFLVFSYLLCLQENPLRTLVRFIKNSAVDKNFDEAVDLIQTFKSQCQNLHVAVNLNSNILSWFYIIFN